jgi:hypothetical protein
VERTRCFITLPAIGLPLLLALSLIAAPLHGSPLVSNLQPGDQWNIEILLESQRIAPVPAQPNKKSKSSIAKGTPIEKNLLGKDFREQAILKSDGSEASRRVLTDSFVIAKVDESGIFALDTLNDEMPGGRPVWNRLTEFSWITVQNRMNRQLVDGIECHIHAEFEDGNSNLPARLAAISTVDGKPLRLETPYEIRRYVWSRVPTPEMPAGAQDALRDFLQEMKRQIQRHNVPR